MLVTYSWELFGLVVFALYNQDYKIGILLSVTLSNAFVISVILGKLTVQALQFDGNCGAPAAPKEPAYFR